MVNSLFDEQIINVAVDPAPNTLDYVQVIATIVFSVLTSLVAYLTYRLQKQTKADADKDKKIENINHASNVYYFLNEVVYKMADTEFLYDSFSNIEMDSKEYMKDINYLRNNVINDSEFLILRELYFLYDGLKNDAKKNQKNFKILYKKIIDNNIKPNEIKQLRKDNRINDITSFPILIIMIKLELQMNNKIKENDRTLLEIKNSGEKLFVRKNYYDKYYLEYNNENISGVVQQYEIVLFFKSTAITSVSELKYEGEIDNNVFNGKGKYYYYTTKNGFDYSINSCMLNEKEVNLDENAQFIKYTLEVLNVKDVIAIYDGTFKNGKISSGKLQYKEKPTDEYKEIPLLWAN